MNSKIKICSINIRSIKKSEKMLYLYDLCEKNKIDLIFIQETHLNEIKFLNEIKNIFKNYTIYMPILDTSY
jgi:exonuclease III